MKFNIHTYHKELLATLMSKHSFLGKEKRFDRIRVTKDGVAYAIKIGSSWRNRLVPQKDVTRIITEVYS